MPQTSATSSKPKEAAVEKDSKTTKGFAKGNLSIPITAANDDDKIYVLGYN